MPTMAKPPPKAPLVNEMMKTQSAATTKVRGSTIKTARAVTPLRLATTAGEARRLIVASSPYTIAETEGSAAADGPGRPASHEQEVASVDRGAVGEGNGLDVGVEAGMDHPLVGRADLGKARTLRHGAEAGEDQGVAWHGALSVEVGDGRAVGMARDEDESVVATRSHERVGAHGDERVGVG